jgi:hypothetical protein
MASGWIGTCTNGDESDRAGVRSGSNVTMGSGDADDLLEHLLGTHHLRRIPSSAVVASLREIHMRLHEEL